MVWMICENNEACNKVLSAIFIFSAYENNFVVNNFIHEKRINKYLNSLWGDPEILTKWPELFTETTFPRIFFD